MNWATKNKTKKLEEKLIIEGVFDFLVSLLNQGGSQWRQYSRMGDEPLLELPKDFNPKESVSSQVDAAVCVLQLTGYAIDTIKEGLDYLEARIEQIAENSDDDEFFGQEVSFFLSYLDENFVGPFTGWVQSEDIRRCSERVYDLGQEIQSEDRAEVLGQVKSFLEQIDRLRIEDQAKKVFDQEGAEARLEEAKYGKYIEEAESSFSLLPEVIERLAPFIENVKGLLELADEKANTPEVQASGEPVQGTVFEKRIPKLADLLFS